MRFLKTLQKAHKERPEVSTPADLEDVGGSDQPSAAPHFAAEPSFKIGRPTGEPVSEQEAPSGLPRVVEELHSVPNNGNAHIRTLERVKPKSRPEPTFQTFDLSRDAVNQRLVAISDPNSPYCEEYRSLRTQIIHQAEQRSLRSIVVVSHGPGEGKTITAINLACMLAQTDGIKALVIDGDLRMPHIGDYLGMETSVGLSEVLSGKADLDKAIIRLEPTGLHLLAGGNDLESAAEMASGQKFKELLDEVTDHFDFVIIDAPPLNLFSDGAAYLNHADGGLLVVRSNRVNFSETERSLEMLTREKILGVVLNDSEEALSSRGYHEYSYYRSRSA